MFKKLLIIIFILSVCFVNYTEPLSDGYRDFKLGMSQEEVKQILERSIDFRFIREEILSFRMEPDTEIISTEGNNNYIINGYFHFSHDQLYQILMKLSETKIGYYYLLKNFTEKYGKPNEFSPKRAIWEDDKIRIVLEKPCTIKYIYLPVWNSLVGEKVKPKEDIYGLNRKKFVDDL